jgi:peptide chain release factor 2
LAQAAEDPNLWNDQANAQKTLKEKTVLQSKIDAVQELEVAIKDTEDLAEFAEELNEDDFVNEVNTQILALIKRSDTMRLEALLSGEADHNPCFLEVHSGAGGTEAQDWALMLLRMYTRWAESRKFKVTYLEESPGEEAGIKSATIKISGPMAYGWLKKESGVHRLVRISPFDSSARRHTSFASIWIYPEIDTDIDITIEEKDLRIDTYRSSGAGGQHVNTTDSAVRITHLPTGIVVQCQNERSQHKNKATAMKILQSRIYEQELRKREEETQKTNAVKGENGWGNQIRSYVLHPYQMVKDLRTGYETGNTGAVLDGNIEGFLESCLSYIE